MTGIRVANAPVSYGAFELTIGVHPGVPGPDEVLAATAAAGYEGTELGPPGYLGEGDELRERLERHGLDLTGGWCQLRFSEPEHWEEDLGALARTLALFAAAGATEARPVFGDAGSELRRRHPGRGKDDPSLGLDDAGWRRFADGLARAVEVARERGFAPVFHPHASTHVEAHWEVERVLDLSDVRLLVDPGHYLIGGIDPVQALLDWGPRVGYVHVKDVRLDIVQEVLAEGADALEAWRRGIFCELGTGDVDLEGFFAALDRIGYEGWVCVEQDRIPRAGEPFSEAAAAQARNREWLRTHVGV